MNKPLVNYFSSLRVEIGAKDCILMRDDAHTISTTTTSTTSDYRNEKSLIHHHNHHNLSVQEDSNKSTTSSHDYHVPIKAPATTISSSSSPVVPRRRGSLENPFDDFLNYNNNPSNILPPSAPCRRNSLPLTTTTTMTTTTTNSSPPDDRIVSTTLSHDDIWGSTRSHSSFSKNNHCLDTSPVFPVRRGSFDTATSPMKKSPTYLRQQQQRSMPKVDMLLEWIHDPIILSPTTTQQQQSQPSVDATDIIMKNNDMTLSPMSRSSYLINQIDDAIAVSGGGGTSSSS